VTKTGVPIGDKDSTQEKNGKSETAGESDNESLVKKSSRIPVVCWIPPRLRQFLETSNKEVVFYDVENSNDTVPNETYDSTHFVFKIFFNIKGLWPASRKFLNLEIFFLVNFPYSWDVLLITPHWSLAMLFLWEGRST